MTDISGTWSGSYVYPGSLEPVPFEAEIRDHGGLISGLIHEPAEAWAGVDRATAIMAGQRQGREVSFVKSYDQSEAYPEPVHYEGTVDEEECEIAGSWVIIGEWSGSFVMTRPKAAEAEERVEETVPVELDRQSPQ